jgi:hypothetical protein
VNIWRIASIVATLGAFGVVAFAGYIGKLTNSHNLLEIMSTAAFFALFMFALITFPYYWFKFARILFFGWAYVIEKKARISKVELRNDALGILTSFLLVLLTVWLGKYFK